MTNIHIDIPRFCTTNCAELIQDTCEKLRDGSLYDQLTYFGNNNMWWAIFNIGVAVFNLWFASVIWRNKSLQVHPMKLFMYIAVAESIYYSN